MGRLEAHRLGLGSQGQLGLRLSRPARADRLAGYAVWLGSIPPRADFFSSMDRAFSSSSFPPRWLLLRLLLLAGRRRLPFSPLLLTARAQTSVSVGSGVVARIRCDRRACVCVAPEGVCGVSAQGALGEMPQWHGRDANATSRPRRGVGAHGEAVAQAWRGWLRLGLAVWVRTHARGAWLPRAAAWPCRARGTGTPGARHDTAAVGRRRLRGKEAARRAPARKGGTAAGGEVLRLLQRFHRRR
jgi:hypothetical protein